MALFVLIYAFTQDVGHEGHDALIYSLPFILALITGKQMIDSRKKT